MNRRNIKPLLLAVMLLLLMGACSVPEEEALSSTEIAAQEAFNKKASKPNKSTEDIKYFLPEEMKVDTEEKNNILLTKGDQNIILFYNPIVQKNDDTIYTDLEKRKGSLLLKKFDGKERDGFLAVFPVEEKTYELIVGVGGVKLTTETSSNKMEESARLMMQIAKSIAFKE